MVKLEFGYGCTRFVILTKKYAIKIPQFKYEWRHFLLGLLANMQEVQFSKMNDERLCPVKFHIRGGWLLIMPRCEPITREIFFDLDIERFCPNNKEDYHVHVENKQNSFGLLNGRIVAIDYGSYAKF